MPLKEMLKYFFGSKQSSTVIPVNAQADEAHSNNMQEQPPARLSRKPTTHTKKGVSINYDEKTPARLPNKQYTIRHTSNSQNYMGQNKTRLIKVVNMVIMENNTEALIGLLDHYSQKNSSLGSNLRVHAILATESDEKREINTLLRKEYSNYINRDFMKLISIEMNKIILNLNMELDPLMRNIEYLNTHYKFLEDEGILNDSVGFYDRIGNAYTYAYLISKYDPHNNNLYLNNNINLILTNFEERGLITENDKTFAIINGLANAHENFSTESLLRRNTDNKEPHNKEIPVGTLQMQKTQTPAFKDGRGNRKPKKRVTFKENT